MEVFVGDVVTAPADWTYGLNVPGNCPPANTGYRRPDVHSTCRITPDAFPCGATGRGFSMGASEDWCVHSDSGLLTPALLFPPQPLRWLHACLPAPRKKAPRQCANCQRGRT